MFSAVLIVTLNGRYPSDDMVTGCPGRARTAAVGTATLQFQRLYIATELWVPSDSRGLGGNVIL